MVPYIYSLHLNKHLYLALPFVRSFSCGCNSESDVSYVFWIYTMPKHVVSIYLRVPTLNLPICRPNDFQVQTKAGDYVDATPIPGTVVINVGDIMQRWTADRLVSTVCSPLL